MVDTVTADAAPPPRPGRPTGSTGRGAAARDRLAGAVLDHLLAGGSPEASLRAMATAVGVSHSLLLYHFGSAPGLLAAVHLACEQREREHLATLRTSATEPTAVMRAMWKHLAQPHMWPVYRLGFTLRLRADVATADQDREREAWMQGVRPLLAGFGLTSAQTRDEALLWVATCRGLLWELVTGADRRRVHRAAERFFMRYEL